MPDFRIHFADGGAGVLSAADAGEARKLAQAAGRPIAKIKLDRGTFTQRRTPRLTRRQMEGRR